jgi:aryl-alcohol dehydrogenase-like predicted oxidoreductase
MDTMQLGQTGLQVSKSGFGALPIQRISFDEAKGILRRAYEAGITFFDTARMYTDSEEKIGYALSDVRSQIVIATKSHAKDKKTLLEHLETSLRNLKTDYIDLYQLHNPKELPQESDEEGLYAALVEAKKKGLIRHIGITNHSNKLAMEAAVSGMYETIQFPLNTLSSEEDLQLITACKERNIGVIAMKGLSGGLITNAATTFSFLRQYDNVVPIWGIQRMNELEQFIEMEKNPPVLDDAMWEAIRKDRSELAGDFCRGCGYCMPCPVGIEIPTQARISLLLGRAPYQPFLEDSFKEKMDRINQCIECGQCKSHCPYQLDTPNLLKRELKRYQEFYAAHVK